MEGKTAVIIGATGLIGGHLLALLHDDERFTEVRVIARKPLNEIHPKLKVHVIDFTDDQAFMSAMKGADAVFCSVGTTRKKVRGDLDEYRKVDFDIPVRAARLCSATGCPVFVMVSSVGADSSSSNYYLRFKGEAEQAVGEFNIPSVSVFRPSMLLGHRKESRPAERIAQMISAPLSFLFPSRYKPVSSADVAGAMINAAFNAKKGISVLHFKEIIELRNPKQI